MRLACLDAVRVHGFWDFELDNNTKDKDELINELNGILNKANSIDDRD